MRGDTDDGDDDGVLTSNPQERAQLSCFFFSFFFFWDCFELLLSINDTEESRSEFKTEKKCGHIKQTK